MLPYISFLDRLKVLRRARCGVYHFPISDYLLYLRHAEYPGPVKSFPAILVMSQDNSYVKLQIGARSYYWPSDANWSGLEWIHQEVFMPASQNLHAYEFAGVRINPGDRVIDAGACAGFFVHYALQRGATVLAVEPVQILSNALEKTFASEVAEGKVKVLPVALGATSGQAKLAMAQERIFESRVASNGIEIQMVALDDIVGQERVDFIKMDIEGAEMDAIRGGTKTIARYKPRLAIAVYHEQENAQQVCQLLRQIRPDYQIRHRGIYAWEGCAPRPFMVYAW